MNNKYIKYILCAGVVIVWTVIAYRIVHGMNDGGMPAIVEKAVRKVAVKNSLDSFSLYADYPDPFIPEKEVNDAVSMPKPTGEPKPVSQQDAARPVLNNEVIAAIIQFNGIVTNPQGKAKVAIVSIRNKELIVHEKDRVDGVLIQRIGKEKLQISYQGRSFTIEKAK